MKCKLCKDKNTRIIDDLHDGVCESCWDDGYLLDDGTLQNTKKVKGK